MARRRPRPWRPGFDKAFLTIIDTHVTTVVSAFFLFLFGTGPIRGFAITLTIGLIANMFHGDLRVQDDFSVSPVEDGPPGDTQYLGAVLLY